MSRLTERNTLLPNKLCGNNRSGMSRPWTRAQNMANGLLKKLALAGMVGASALLGAREAKAAPVTWGQVTDVVRNAEIYGYPSTDYSANSINFTNGQGGETIVNNPQFSFLRVRVFDS